MYAAEPRELTGAEIAVVVAYGMGNSPRRFPTMPSVVTASDG